MVISPVVPTTPPELDAVSPPLTLPFRRDSPFLEMLKAATRPVPQANLAPANHRVRSGESLWRICENALKADGVAPTKPEINAAVHRVAAANRLKDANVLAVGQQLDLTAVRVMAPAAGHLESKLDAAGAIHTARSAALTQYPRSASTAAPGQPTAPDPVAALTNPRPTPMGGGIGVSRPLFRRLSNARPELHVVSHAHAAQVAALPAKPVDLTALMQSILEPQPAAPETPAMAGPWSALLGGAGRFTSGYGLRSDPFTGKPQFHEGIDIAAATGTVIYPYMPGTVRSAGWDAGRGNTVVVEHPDGTETVYAHASEMLVKAGDIVLKDTPIAKVGSTGHSTGPHLHFEVRKNNKPVNPLPLVKQPSLDVAKAL